MSRVARDWAWSQSLPPTPKFVLVALAERADEAGVCWPSMSQLAEITGLAERTLQMALRALEASGHLACERGAGRTRSRYQLQTGGAQQMRLRGAANSPQDRERCTSEAQEMHPRDAADAPRGRSTCASHHLPVDTVSSSTVIKPSTTTPPPYNPPSPRGKGDGGGREKNGPAFALFADDPPRAHPPASEAQPAGPLLDAAPPSPPSASASPAIHTPAARTRHRIVTRIPPDWRPSERVYRWGAQRGLSACWIDQHLTEFIAYWSDCGKPMKSWDATYLNNLQRIMERQRHGPPIRPAFRPSSAERMRLAGLQYLASLGVRPAPDDALDADGGNLSPPLVGDAWRTR